MRTRSISLRFANNPRLLSLLILAVLILSACQPAAIPLSAQPTAMPTTAPAPSPTSAPTPTPTTMPTIAPTTAPPTAPPATATPAFQEPTISIAADPKLGNILVGDNGMTLYIFTMDEPDKSNCDLDCLAMWPPLLTQGSPNLGAGVDPSLVGAATLADGSTIVTYNKMPLYYWSEDLNPGDTTGEGVGEVWFVLSPTGTVVFLQAASPTSKPAKDKEKEGDY